MREIALFVEDFAHRQVIGALVRRLAEECGVDARLEWRSAVRGHGRVVRELGDYLRDLGRQGGRMPDLIVVESTPFGEGRNRHVEETRLWRALASFHVSKDILVYSRDEVDYWCDSLNHVLARALREGRVLYERP